MYQHTYPKPQPKPGYRELTAKSFGPCAHCAAGIHPGDRIANTGTYAGKPWGHVDCAAAATAHPPVEAKPLPTTGPDISGLNGSYAVENGAGELTFLRIDSPKDGKWAGWSFVKQQQGPNEVRLGKQRPGGRYEGIWPTLLTDILDDPEQAMTRYGKELGTCGHCGLELTNAESRAYGIGPVCRKALGW